VKHDDQVDSTSQALDYLREPDDVETWQTDLRQLTHACDA
jgi:phage terminase large subunit-like protein